MPGLGYLFSFRVLSRNEGGKVSQGDCGRLGGLVLGHSALPQGVQVYPKASSCHGVQVLFNHCNESGEFVMGELARERGGMVILTTSNIYGEEVSVTD